MVAEGGSGAVGHEAGTHLGLKKKVVQGSNRPWGWNTFGLDDKKVVLGQNLVQPGKINNVLVNLCHK